MEYPTEKIEEFLKKVGSLSREYGLSFAGSINADMWTEETHVNWNDEEEEYEFKYNVDNNGHSEYEWKSVKPENACEHEWEYKWQKGEEEYARFCVTCKKYQGRGVPNDDQTLQEIDRWLKGKLF